MKAFNDNCVGKMECSMPFDFSTMFDAPCNQEIVRRIAGKTTYGPAKIFGMAVCEKDDVSVLGFKITR